jgi:hypothetical protein
VVFASLLGDFWGPVVFWAVIIGTIIYKICQACAAHEARQKEENFKYSNPKEYAQLQQIEHERQMMAHDEKRMTHDKMQTGAGIFAEILRIFRK